MSKIIFLITSVFYLGLCFGQANGKAYYIKDINTAFEKKLDSLSNIPGNPIKSLEKSTKNLEFVLSFNEDTALYKEVEQMSTDNNKSIELAKILSGYVGPSYFDFKNRKVIFEKDLFNELYLVERDISALEWVLKKEKLVLNNLTCYKAITSITVEGRGGTEEIPITAWYTSDINISAGPDGFGFCFGIRLNIAFDCVRNTLTSTPSSQNVAYDNITQEIKALGIANTKNKEITFYFHENIVDSPNHNPSDFSTFDVDDDIYMSDKIKLIGGSYPKIEEGEFYKYVVPYTNEN